MKNLILAATLILPTSAFAQQQADGGTTPKFNTLPPTVTLGATTPQRLPDYGYVVYDNAGKPVKAFGPDTPIRNENGSIDIVGGGIPAGWTVKTEDAATFLKALAAVSSDETTESDYTQNIREMLESINVGAAIVKDTLCENPSRPSLIRVEVAGGFSFGVYGSITSTVDWDLDKICPTAAATAQ